MVLRVFSFIALAYGSVNAADISGAWTGNVDVNGNRVPLNLVLRQCDGTSGTVSIGSTAKPVPISNAAIEGNRLTFASEYEGWVLRFRLVLNGVSLTGDVVGPGRTFEVALSAIGGRTSYTTGGAVPPVIIHKVEPKYTEAAGDAKVKGTVVLRVVIEPNGAVAPDQIHVLRSLGRGLDEKAIEAVRQWRFKPANCEGKPIRMEAQIEVSFRL